MALSLRKAISKSDLRLTGGSNERLTCQLDKRLNGSVPLQIDGLVDHFMQFQREERVLPVVWHQCLLCFVQR